MRSCTCLLLVLAAALGGCKQWKAPEKIDELEKRVDELSEVVSQMKGHPVGKKKKPPKPDAGADDEVVAETDEGPDAGVEAKAAEEEKPAAKHDEAKKEVAKKDDQPADKPAEKKDDPPPAPPPHHASSGGHWSYDGDSGPEHWGDLDDAWASCGRGEEQSPVDVVPQTGAKRASDIVFVYQPTKARVVDTGHTLQVNFDAGNSIFIDGHRYDLVQLHAHTPSEHTLLGERYPLELHLVHKDAEGKLAVVAVLYDEGASSPLLDSVYRRWPSRPDDEKSLGKIDVASLLPDSRGVFRYQGSLTTPPCSEGVVWNVMRRTRTDSSAHLALFKKHYAANARPVQALHGRDIQ